MAAEETALPQSKQSAKRIVAFFRELWSSLWVRRRTPSSIINALKKGPQAERSISTT